MATILHRNLRPTLESNHQKSQAIFQKRFPWAFASFNSALHGISFEDVQNSPTLLNVNDELVHRVANSVLVSHTFFDRCALGKALQNRGLEPLPVTWLDSATVARKAWPERYGKRGYGLKNIARDLGIPFRHHDAMEDARASAEIVIRACRSTGQGIEHWLRMATGSTAKSGLKNPRWQTRKS